jgi:DnaK suppressor protein
MDQDRARELLAAERERIERALARRRPQDTAEPADEIDPGNLASELYQEELDQGLADDLREELAAVERAEARLSAGTYGLSIESGRRSRTSASKRCRPSSERPKRKRARRVWRFDWRNVHSSGR